MARAAEKAARLHSCDPMQDARALSAPGDAQQNFDIRCSNGKSMVVACVNGDCSTNAGSAPVTAAPAAVAPAGGQQVAAAYMAPQARSSAAQVKPLWFAVSVGGAFGGDSLATVEYSNNSTTSLDAGRGAQFSFGVDYRINDDFAVLGNVGYQVVDASASNGSLRFQRYPVEGIGYYYLNPQWRVGLGVRDVMNPKVVGSGFANGADVSFGNAVGGIVEVEWFPTRRVGVKLRGVKESYKPDGSSQSFSGNSVGFFGTYYF